VELLGLNLGRSKVLLKEALDFFFRMLRSGYWGREGFELLSKKRLELFSLFKGFLFFFVSKSILACLGVFLGYIMDMGYV